MRVLVTGASGFVGRHIVAALVLRGDAVVALSRHAERHPWPEGVQPVAWDARSPIPDVAADAVVNLAGERVVGRRWTAAHMRALRDSRIIVTRRVVEWMNREHRPPALVSASAAGYYGHDAVGPCLESRPPGTGFLADLARDWEAEARAAPGRLVLLRLGHVLARDGGYLSALLPFVRLHLAGPIAGGRQPMPWVHIDDVVSAFLWALDGEATGPFNVVSPGAASGTQRAFASALAVAAGKPRQASVPLWAIRLRFGGGVGPALTGGQDLRPAALQGQDFAFRHTDLGQALRDVLS